MMDDPNASFSPTMSNVAQAVTLIQQRPETFLSMVVKSGAAPSTCSRSGVKPGSKFINSITRSLDDYRDLEDFA